MTAMRYVLKRSHKPRGPAQLRSVWQSYLTGAGMALDPLPYCRSKTFEDADFAALYKDMMALLADKHAAYDVLARSGDTERAFVVKAKRTDENAPAKTPKIRISAG